MSIMHNECKEAIAQQGHNDAASNLFNNSGPLIPGDLMQPSRDTAIKIIWQSVKGCCVPGLGGIGQQCR